MFKKIVTNCYFLPLFSAILLRLAFPKFNLWPMAFIGFIPFFLAWKRFKLKQIILSAFLGGWLFYITLLFWLINVTVTGMFVLSAYLAGYIVLFSIGFDYAQRKLSPIQRIIFLPVLWVILEFIRSFLLTGFPWELLAYSQSFNLPAIQIADTIGAFGVSFLVMLVNVFLFETFVAKTAITRRQVIVVFIVIALWFGYGVYRIFDNSKKGSGLRVSVIQGNIAQEIKWVSSLKENIFRKYKILTEITVLRDEADMVVWPETAYPEYFETKGQYKELSDFVKSINVPLLFGSIRFENMRYYNSAIFLSSRAKILGVYDKLHLVPFGEYIPARKLCPFLCGLVPIEDFSSGSNYKIFSVLSKDKTRFNFGVLICFEDVFAALAPEFVKKGADFLVNITNDGWFGDTSSPYQHLEASIFRAVENRVYVMRAANTGISCFIDDIGRVTSVVKNAQFKETFVTGSATSMVYKKRFNSLYTKFGDIFVMFCLLYCVGTMVLCRKKI